MKTAHEWCHMNGGHEYSNPAMDYLLANYKIVSLKFMVMRFINLIWSSSCAELSYFE